jgi:hypothetical protein
MVYCGQGALLSDEQYAATPGALGAAKKFKALTAESWAQDALARLSELHSVPLHWELVFPDVFLAPKQFHGFDVILGNPPYDVLSEKESGISVDHLKRFIRAQTSRASVSNLSPQTLLHPLRRTAARDNLCQPCHLRHTRSSK